MSRRIAGAAPILVATVLASGPAGASTVPDEAGPPSLADLTDLAASFLGPTDDAVGELQVLMDVPASIPTPRGATVTELTFSVYLDEDPYISAGVTVTTDARAADVLTFYETELTAAGYTQISETQQNANSLVSNRLTFDQTDSALPGASLDVVVMTSDLAPGTSVEVSFTAVAESHHLDPFRGWATGLPLPEGGELTEAWMFLSTLIEPSVTLRAGYEYAPGVDALGTEASFDAALPVNGWSIDTDVTGDDLPGITNLDSDEIAFGDVSFRETGFEPPHGTLVDVTVTARLTP